MDAFQKMMEKLKAKSQAFSETTVPIKTDFNCDKCKDDGGWTEIRKADVFGDGRIVRDEEVWVVCPCQTQRKARLLMKSSEITEDFQKLNFNNYETEGREPVVAKIKQRAIAYCKDFQNIRDDRANSIAILGQPGVGKTHILSAIANGMMTNWLVGVHYFPYVEGLEDLKASFGDDTTSVATKLQRLKDVEVLFVDDLFKPLNGKPRATDWQVEKMFEIINYRYLNKKPILVSSELSFDDMLAIDQATATRIFEMCSKYTITVEDDIKLNYRLKDMFKED